MKAVVLAGGHATRLWPLTRHRAKPLLPLAGRPLVDYLVAELEGHVDEVLISTNAKYGDDFRDYLTEHGRDARVVEEEQASEDEKPGTIGAIIDLLDREDLDDDLLVVGGDNYFGFDIADLVDFIATVDGPVNAVYDIGETAAAGEFGVVDTDGDRITGFAEKPDEPPSSLVSTAVYYFPREHLSLFDDYEQHFAATDIPASEYLDEPGRLIEWAHEKTAMYAYAFEGDWFDIGTPQNYLQAQAAVGEQQVDGQVTGSDLGANVWVMDGATVESSRLEDCIVFPGAEIRDASLESTIVDEEATVEGTELEESVIGEFSTVR
ncbi:MAG: NDP-sugar synthase [Candidatus Nanohaloarchaea archaeon]|nr:NDP-sugar synthase [Candidatus Nanohaloarchaea archaeon]